MKFIENYQDRQWAALAITPEEKEELIRRLESGNQNIEIEDLFENDQYKIERIKVVRDWSEFQNEAQKRDSNIKWTTRAVWALIIILIFFAIIGFYNVISYVT